MSDVAGLIIERDDALKVNATCEVECVFRCMMIMFLVLGTLSIP